MISSSHRKDSYQGGSESEEDLDHMFPRRSIQDLQGILDMLKHHYNKDIHSFQLANYCFRCHRSQFYQAYEQFRLVGHPELTEPRISNLYQNNAFADLKELGRRIKKEGFQFPGPHIPPIPKNLAQILNSLFQDFGYVPNYERFLLYYPTYLQKHISLQKQLFESGKIDSKIAYFLALCGAAEVGSAYMISRWLTKFLQSGGLLQWIKQAKYPKKLKSILELNRLMCRATWLIDPGMIENILQNEQFHWSKNELAVCIQIMAFSHQTATIALAVGLLPEDSSNFQIMNLKQIIEAKTIFDNIVYESAGQVKQKLAEIIPVLQQLDAEDSEGQKISQFKKQFVNIKLALKKSMRRSQFVDTYMKEVGNQLNRQEMYQKIIKFVDPLLPPFYVIEKRKESVFANIDYSEFNFKFMAYPILHSYTQGLADKMQNIISYSEIMTRGNFGNQKNNHTKQFRRAVRYYAQNLCGYTHHQYDFKNNVTSILSMALKFYIRLVMVSPLHISQQVVRETNHESGQIECFDLGHLAILIANTKMSLELTLTIQAFEE